MACPKPVPQPLLVGEVGARVGLGGHLGSCLPGRPYGRIAGYRPRVCGGSVPFALVPRDSTRVHVSAGSTFKVVFRLPRGGVALPVRPTQAEYAAEFVQNAGEGRYNCQPRRYARALAALGFKRICLTRKAGHSERPVNMPPHWQPRVAASSSLSRMVATAFNSPRLQLPTEAGPGVKVPGSGGRFHPRCRVWAHEGSPR